MTQRKVLFLGAAYSQIPIIREAKSKGWYIITCDYLPNNPGHKLADEYYNISTTDVEAVFQLAQKLQPDFVIAYASDPAAPVAAFVSEKLSLPGNPYISVRNLSEKDLFRKFLLDNGFNAPKSISIKQEEDFSDKINLLEFPLVVKPTDSSGSKGVVKVASLKDFKKAADYAFSYSRNKRIIAEEFIESNGEQLHGDGFVSNGELIFTYLGDHHYNQKINSFVPYSTTWPSKYSPKIISEVEKELKKFIRISGYKNGPVNIEVRINAQGKIFIMEIGPRSGGNFVPQIINYTTGFNMVSASLEVLDNHFHPIKTIRQGFGAYYVIHSKQEGELTDLSFKKELSKNIKEFHQYKYPGDKIESFQGANAAIGVLLLKFKDRQEMNHIINSMENYINLKIDESALCQ